MAHLTPALMGVVLLVASACGQTTRDGDRGGSGGEPFGTSGAGTIGGTESGGAVPGQAGQGNLGGGTQDGSGGQGGTSAGGMGAAAGAGAGGTGDAIECLPRNDDPTGYLVKICEYLVASDTVFVDIDPNQYHIESIETRTEDGRELIWVFLDCCYMGDIAFIDPETGEVIGVSPGDV